GSPLRQASLQQLCRTRGEHFRVMGAPRAPAELAIDEQRREAVHERPRRNSELSGTAALEVASALPVGDRAHEQVERLLGRRLEARVSTLVADLRTEHDAEMRRMGQREPYIGLAELPQLAPGILHPLTHRGHGGGEPDEPWLRARGQ